MARTFGKREFLESGEAMDPSADNIRLWARANKDLLESAGWKFEDHHRDPKLYSPDGFYVDVIRNAGGDNRAWQWAEERNAPARPDRGPRIRSDADRQALYGTWGYAPRGGAVPRGTPVHGPARRSPARRGPDPVSRERSRPAGVRETTWTPPRPNLRNDVRPSGSRASGGGAVGAISAGLGDMLHDVFPGLRRAARRTDRKEARKEARRDARRDRLAAVRAGSLRDFVVPDMDRNIWDQGNYPRDKAWRERAGSVREKARRRRLAERFGDVGWTKDGSGFDSWYGGEPIIID